MNKTEFAKAVAAKAELSQVQAKAVTNAVLEVIEEALVNEDPVRFVGFGTFEVKDVPARKGINPRTNEPIEIPARKKVSFKAGADLVGKVNK